MIQPDYIGTHTNMRSYTSVPNIRLHTGAARRRDCRGCLILGRPLYTSMAKYVMAFQKIKSAYNIARLRGDAYWKCVFTFEDIS